MFGSSKLKSPASHLSHTWFKPPINIDVCNRPEAVIALFIIPKEKSYGHASAANLEGT